MISKIVEGLALLRPRNIKRLEKAAATIRELRGAIKDLTDHEAALGAQMKDATTELRSLVKELTALRLREAQLRSVIRADLEFDEDLSELEDMLSSSDGIAAHISAAIDPLPLRRSPFPHVIVDNVLPAPLYEALIRGLPPAVLFEDQPANHQQLPVPFEVAPRYSRRVWDFMAKRIGPTMVQPVVVRKFGSALDEWLRANFPLNGNALDSIKLRASFGRIMRRGRGYNIPPHRDPKWGFITCLLYLARPGDDDRWGTQFYTVAEDDEARGAKPHWIDAKRCTLAVDVPFKPNRMLIFLNSEGAHGANIPGDAEPETLERYAYQFRIGANGPTIRSLIASLPEDRRVLWAGKISDY